MGVGSWRGSKVVELLPRHAKVEGSSPAADVSVSERDKLAKKKLPHDVSRVISRYDQGILDVGLTDEDHVDLVKTHTFMRKHATGSAKIELHVLQVRPENE